jgi:hypothetical protein
MMMPRTQLGLNANLQANDAGSGGRKKIASVVDELQDVSDVMREKNNIVNDGAYRIDARPITTATVAGTVAGDYKVDVQDVTKQKKLSETYGVVFVAPDCTNASLQDLKDALNLSATDFHVYRVHNAGVAPQVAATKAPQGSGKHGRSTGTAKWKK